MEPLVARALKHKLNEWKANQSGSSEKDRRVSSDQDDAFSELRPVGLIPDEKLTSLSRQPEVNLDSLLQGFCARQAKKVEVKGYRDICNTVQRKAEDERKQMKAEMELDKEHGKNNIPPLAPGVVWLDVDPSAMSLSMLPLSPPSIPEADLKILTCMRCPTKCVRLAKKCLLMLKMIEHKTLLLDNMFLAMCLHQQQSAVELLKSQLEAFLTNNYESAGVDKLTSLWTPKFEHLMMILKHFGARSVDSVGDEVYFPTQNSFSKVLHPYVSKIEGYLNIVDAAHRYRNTYSETETLKLTKVVAKLSLDQSLLSAEKSEVFQMCMHSLILSVLTSGTGLLNGQSSNIELELCHCLLSVATHHHNKLHIVNLIPPISKLAIDLKSTLAYLTICQLGASQRNEKLTSTDWSFISLADEYFNLRIDESADMYLLHSLISLFEIAVGNEIEPEERSVLEDMRQLMCKQCRALNENPMLPNVSQLKGLMLKVSLKWDKLVKQATPIDDLLGITHKPTPTKIIPVDSQEVRLPGHEEDGEMMDETAAATGDSEMSTLSPTSNMPRSFSTASKVLAVNLDGISKLRKVAKQCLGSRAIAAKCDPGNRLCSTFNGLETSLSTPKSVIKMDSNLAIGKVPTSVRKLMFSEQVNEVESMEVDDLPDLD